MSRMNSRTRKKLYPILVLRDGEYCNMCGKVGSTKSLIIDHIDNNPRNNALHNLQLLCRGCNHRKNPRGEAKPKNQNIEIHEPPASKEMLKNEICEPIFRDWLEEELRRWGRKEVKDALNAGAEVAGVSPATTERYLSKMTSSAGKLSIVVIDGVKFVAFKDIWNPK